MLIPLRSTSRFCFGLGFLLESGLGGFTKTLCAFGHLESVAADQAFILLANVWMQPGAGLDSCKRAPRPFEHPAVVVLEYAMGSAQAGVNLGLISVPC